MPPLEEMDLDETALLFAWSGTGRNGRAQVTDDAVEMAVRWVETNGRLMNKDGTETSFDAEVACKVVARIGSVMWLGSLADVPGTSDPPVPTSDLFQVVSVDRAKSIDVKHTRREYKLVRLAGTLPTGA